MTVFNRAGLVRGGVLAVLLVGAVQLGGCGTLGYYAQSVRGQLDLLYRAEPIDHLLADPETPPQLAGQLRRVGELRRFAAEQLALPDKGSYHDYIDVGREALVWSVVATEEFSLTPRQWCFPVIGCTSYRGYFRRAGAERYAERLRGEGLDVAIERVPAYSTLGWFDDPLPSTVISWPDYELAGLIFHELAHQRLYLPGDSGFNEAYATVVERNGIERWLSLGAGGEAERRYRQSRAREIEFLELLALHRDRLQALYAGTGTDAFKREAKAGIFAELKRAYAELKAGWRDYGGYDIWFDRTLNNAHLASVATYEDRVPALQRLFVESESDFARFHAAIERLADLSVVEREHELARLAEE